VCWSVVATNVAVMQSRLWRLENFGFVKRGKILAAL
jgi:hypothetical protein